jgi:hypothetical protein
MLIRYLHCAERLVAPREDLLRLPSFIPKGWVLPVAKLEPLFATLSCRERRPAFTAVLWNDLNLSRGTDGLQTRRWRKADSNRWSHLRLNGSDAATRDEQIAMSPLRRLDKQSLERADAVEGVSIKVHRADLRHRGVVLRPRRHLSRPGICLATGRFVPRNTFRRGCGHPRHISQAERLSAQHGIRP